MKNIYLIVGKSGAGKSSLTQALCKDFGYKEVQSYTERPRRFEDEVGHIFVSKEEFDKLEDLCAYTVFNGNRYGVPSSMVDECDLYVIDTYGVKYMKEHYRGVKGIKVIGVQADINSNDDELSRYQRMVQRGDSEDSARDRISHDKIAFDDLESILDFKVINNDFYKAVNQIKEYIDECEGVD